MIDGKWIKNSSRFDVFDAIADFKLANLGAIKNTERTIAAANHTEFGLAIYFDAEHEAR